MFAREINRAHPQRHGRHQLCAPGHILPHGSESAGVANLPCEQGYTYGEDGQAQQQSRSLARLVQPERFCQNQACRAEGATARGDGSRHDTQKGEDAARNSQPRRADGRHDRGSVEELDEQISFVVAHQAVGTRGELLYDFGRAYVTPSVGKEEVAGDGSPDERHEPLGHHGSVEYGSSLALALHAARHHRGLCGVESAYGSAGDGHEEGREERLLESQAFGAPVAQSVPYLRQHGLFPEQHDADGDDHEQHRERKGRIDLADNLVHGHHRGGHVVEEDEDHPHHLVAPDAAENDGRAVDEECAHQHHHQHGEEDESLARRGAEVEARELRQSAAVVPQGEHAADVVVHGTSEDTSQHNPEICRWTEPHTHDGSEDRSCSGDVQELNHEDTPRWQHHVVNLVRLADGRGLAVVGTEDAFGHPAVNHIAQKKGNDTNSK